MKILIVSQYYYPEQFQINEIAPALVREGHQVTVLTGLPNYPKGEIYEGYKDGYKSLEVVDGVEVIRVKEHPRKKGALHLLWNYWSFASKGKRKAKRLKEKYDIVFAYQLSPVTSVYPAIQYSKKHKTPLLLYCLDIWPESAQAQLHTNKSLLYKMVARLSRNIYQKCTHIAVTSRPFIDYLSRENGIPQEKMSYIPQHASSEFLSLNLAAEDNGVTDFMYAGNLGKGQRIDVIIRAAEILKDRTDFRIHIVGDGSQRTDLEALVKACGVQDKVVFYGNQSRADMPEYYKKADALLITLRGNNAVGDTMPGKLQTYMTTGKPIFGAINGAARETIEEAQCGKCVPAEDSIGLAEIMKEYLERPENFVDCGENAKNYFKEHFTKELFMISLQKKMFELVGEDGVSEVV